MEHKKVGSTELEIMKHLAIHRNSLIKQTYDTIKKDRKSVNLAFVNLQKKGLVEKGEIVTTTTHNKYQGYELTDEGVIIAIIARVDLNKLSDNYPENPLMAENNRICRIVKNRSLANKILLRAAKLWLSSYSNKEQLNEHPDMLIDSAFEAIQFYGSLTKREEESLTDLNTTIDNMIDMDPSLKEVLHRKKLNLLEVSKRLDMLTNRNGSAENLK